MRIKFSKLYRVKSCFSQLTLHTRVSAHIFLYQTFLVNLALKTPTTSYTTHDWENIFWLISDSHQWLPLSTLTMILHLLFSLTPLINCWSNLGKHTVRLATPAPTEIRSFWGKLLSRLEVKEEEKLKSFDWFLSEIICLNFKVWTLLTLCNIWSATLQHIHSILAPSEIPEWARAHIKARTVLILYVHWHNLRIEKVFNPPYKTKYPENHRKKSQNSTTGC